MAKSPMHMTLCNNKENSEKQDQMGEEAQGNPKAGQVDNDKRQESENQS
ncbi:MAG: hypothetical protein R2751_01710 [Bacteroidales bacterium]